MTKKKWTKQKESRPPKGGCVFCVYRLQSGCWGPVALSVEDVLTLNGWRALCLEHARDAIRAGEETEQ